MFMLELVGDDILLHQIIPKMLRQLIYTLNANIQCKFALFP